jgi:hypothetical protein
VARCDPEDFRRCGSRAHNKRFAIRMLDSARIAIFPDASTAAAQRTIIFRIA